MLPNDKQKPLDETKNPFATGAAMNGLARAVEVPAMLARARRVQLLQLAVALVLVLGIAAGACWYIYTTWERAEKRLSDTQNWSSANARNAVLITSNYAMQARLAQSQAAFSADQSRRDREQVTGLRVETFASLTNAAIELQRRLARQLTEQSQTNQMAFDLNYAARLQSFEAQAEKQREELQRSTLDKLKQLNKELGRYDPLLKIDPDVAGRIETALTQLKQLIEITELLKARDEQNLKTVQNQITVLTEQVKVLELRNANLQMVVSNLLGQLRAVSAPAPAPGVVTPPNKN